MTSSSLASGLLVGVLAMSSCSGGSASPGTTIVAAGTSTTFRTEPVRTTTTTVAPPPEADDPADERDADEPAGEQTYEIRSGDFLLGIARRFDVTPEAIVAYNGWESMQHPLQPGATMLIPPQDWEPTDGAGATTGDSGPADDAPVDDGATCRDGSAQETYEIRAGDTKGRVAQRFGVTVAELDAANASTPYYAGFVIGIEIVIPC